MSAPEGLNVRNFLLSRSGLVLIGFLAVAGYFLWTEHRAHAIAALPWLLIGGCLLMHLFMHHGHGGHGDDHDSGHRDPPGERGDS
ncbi:MAG: DUF2933 domain-containing protein [Kiloniellaceae bacterium]